MSLLITGDKNLYGISNVIRQNYYMSTYYALTNTNVFIEYKNPFYIGNFFALTSSVYLSAYVTDFGDGSSWVYSEPEELVYHKYMAEGNYFVSYSAIYITQNSSTIYETRKYTTDFSFTIKSNWDLYNPSDVRLNDEIILTLPYTLDQIEIQPNEWGVDDIFNTSISRLQECLDYLIAKTQTINTYSPTLFFGWLGNQTGTDASRIKWSTQSYNVSYLNTPQISKNRGFSFFKNVKDTIECYDKNLLLLLDDNLLRVFKNTANPKEMFFTTGDSVSSFLIEPVSIVSDETNEIFYIADKISNTVYKINILENDANELSLNLQLFVGGFGGLFDNNNFNTPTEVYYINNNVYVLDYNNLGVKQYNKDLNWIHTYNIKEFDTDKPISMSAMSNGLLYVLTENYKVYIFDNKSNIIFESFDVSQARDDFELKKIIFDENDNFIYILTEQNIYKYTISGVYVNTLIIPKDETVKYKNIKKGKNGTILISSDKCVLKIHDILQVFRLGDGLPYKYWSDNQLMVNKQEFASDIVYNRSLKRLAKNILYFKNTLNSRFIIAIENAQNNIITYFSYLPIDAKIELPYLGDFVEKSQLGVGINELHVPAVFNREFEKVYNSLLLLTDFLSIKNYNVKNTDCLKSFCWSWDATACYNVKLPLLKTCNVNPISFSELVFAEKDLGMTYAPSYKWMDAKSKCCEKRNLIG